MWYRLALPKIVSTGKRAVTALPCPQLPVPASPVNFIQLTTPAAKNRFQDTQWDLCCGGVWEYLCCNSSSVMHWLKPLVKSLPEFSCWILLTLEPYLGTMLGNALCCLKCWWAVNPVRVGCPGLECSGFEWVHTQTRSGAAVTGTSGVRILPLGMYWPREPGAGVTSVSGLSVTLPD